MIMTGENQYGLYETKEDRKLNTIESLKNWNKELEDAETMRKIQMCMHHCTRLERILSTEYKMTEEEIFELTN